MNWNVDAGNIITSTLLSGIGLGVIKLYALAHRIVRQHEQMYDDVDKHAGVINSHTTLIVRAGLADGASIPRLDRRRQVRIIAPDIEGDLL
jgi:hypothetical protein